MVNWDEALSYDTVKIVRVRDKYLGLIRFILMFIILLYIIVKVVIIDKSYYIHDSPGGSVRISLQQPPHTTMSDEPFCPQHPGWESACDKVKKGSWPYPAETCISDPKYKTLIGKPIACQVYDAHDARYPADEQNAIFVATRIISERQVYACGRANTNDEPTLEDVCEVPWVLDPDPSGTPEGIFFLAGVQNLTLGIQHSVFGQSAPFSSDIYRGNSRGYEGKIQLNPKDPKSIRYFPASKSDTPDIISMGEVLTAAGVSLAEPSKDPENSLLYSGTVVLVLVKYSNDDGVFHPVPTEPKYEYIVRRVANSDYKMFETKMIADQANKRLLIKRAGPKVIFIVTGDFAQFNFQTLLIQLASAIGLLSVATLVVETLMLKVMKWRRHYAAAKFEDTNDFSALYASSETDENFSTSQTESTNSNYAQF